MAGIRTENKVYEVGMYCRLSKDDGTDNESASIATQKSILTDYVKKQGWHLAKTYVDDGYSGTNFQRPSFQNMIKDIESGVINCVITKDLSRLGRNYLDCGLYLEVFFPEHNVRYIAVNDGVDTLNKSAMDITPFRNILNEMYAADISVKIKSAFRARFQQGKYMATSAPYGYIKDPADHNHLLIDDKVAHIVREIFDLALQGYGIPKIRKHINKQHILRPAAYAAERGETGFERYFEDNEENRYIWGENSIRNILRSPIYAGNLAGYKRISPSMKSRKRLSKLPEEWEVIPDTHEGIVTQEEFDTVQRLMTSRRREENAGGFKNIFAGIIKCADCGYALRATSVHRRKRPDIIDCVQYSCNNYARNGNGVCTAHNIEARDLFNAVLADINRFADMAVNDEKAVRAIEKRLTETDHSRAKALEKEQRKLNKRLAELDRLFSSLYEDKVMERITERNFEMMSGKYQKEQLEIEARLKEVTETLSDSYEKTQGVRDFLSLIRNYQGIKELDATIINALIDKILVSEREKLTDGMVRQEIKIYYKFIGFVGELHITPTKRWTALKPKNCTVCGVEYVPRSGISKYCPACAKKIQREKSNESKRRSRERNRQACIELSAKNDRLMCSHIAAFRVQANMRTAMMEHIMKLPLGYVEKEGTGKLRKVVNDSSAATETFLAHNLPDKVVSVATPVGLLVVMFVFDWRLGIASLIPAVLAFIMMGTLMMGPKMAEDMKQYQNALETMSSEAVEYVRGIPVVKTFGQTVYSFKKFKAAIDDYEKWTLDYTKGMMKPMVLFTMSANGIFAALIIVAYILGGNHVSNTFVLNLIFYILITSVLTTTLMKIAYAGESQMLVEDALQRMDDILNAKPLVNTEKQEIPKDASITMEHVTFAYDEAKKNAIDDISMKIPTGAHIAFVGPSGGGKTTLASLVARFWDVKDGSIKIGGVDVKNIDTKKLMEEVSYVFQDSKLLKISILENIRMGRPDATDEEVMQALSAAQCMDIIEKFPAGVHTMIGSKGIYVSGGEAQRLSIARAFLKNAPILILDEATAFADPDNERLVQKAFENLAKDKTVIMIAHRLSTITDADCIYVLKDGKIAENGTHEELSEKNGIYTHMWKEYNKSVNWQVGRKGETA